MGSANIKPVVCSDFTDAKVIDDTINAGIDYIS